MTVIAQQASETEPQKLLSESMQLVILSLLLLFAFVDLHTLPVSEQNIYYRVILFVTLSRMLQCHYEGYFEF